MLRRGEREHSSSCVLFIHHHCAMAECAHLGRLERGGRGGRRRGVAGRARVLGRERHRVRAAKVVVALAVDVAHVVEHPRADPRAVDVWEAPQPHARALGGVVLEGEGEVQVEVEVQVKVRPGRGPGPPSSQ